MIINFFKQIQVLLDFIFFSKNKKTIIFYSEGPSCWPHLSGLVTNLLKNNSIFIGYVSSSLIDPGLNLKKKNFKSFYVKTGYLLNWLFENLDVKILILSTPDLNNFQLKKSKNNNTKYIYIHHSLVSHHMVYNKGAFDNYDYIFCCGPHHNDEIRLIESKYNLPVKELFNFGYSFFDHFNLNYKKNLVRNKKTGLKAHILIAPSWGKNSILEFVGEDLIKTLLNKNYNVTVRAHPQTIKLAASKYLYLVNKFTKFTNFSIDEDFDSTSIYSKSDLLITDYSGTSFEYAFAFLKPVLFIDLPKKINNPDYLAINKTPVEICYRDKIGNIISSKNFDNIDEDIQILLKKYDRKKIKNLRSNFLYNFSNAAPKGAKKILNIFNKL